ncbi:DUF732 domain-containing protein [Streptomyces sp. MS06]|uniref:DUF732 domain-containing protein n=1 Tax=Streptomyces sp. MS06 TaxID=3385974 RepID=UPI0039A2F98A
MRIRTAVLPLITVLALTGCSSTSEGPAPDATPTIGVSDLGIDPSAGIPPAPTGKDRAAYLAAARAIDPAITSEMWSDTSLIAAGRDACQAIHQDVAAARQADQMAARLSYDGWTATTDEAQQLIAVAHTHICPTY